MVAVCPGKSWDACSKQRDNVNIAVTEMILVSTVLVYVHHMGNVYCCWYCCQRKRPGSLCSFLITFVFVFTHLISEERGLQSTNLAQKQKHTVESF